MIIHSCVHHSQHLFDQPRFAKLPRLARYGPSAVGLAIIPFMPLRLEEMGECGVLNGTSYDNGFGMDNIYIYPYEPSISGAPKFAKLVNITPIIYGLCWVIKQLITRGATTNSYHFGMV